MYDNLIEPESANERISICYGVSVLALNAVFSTRLRDGIPEWSRVHPFDCLYASVDHIALLVVQSQLNRGNLQSHDSNDEHETDEDDQQALHYPQRRRAQAHDSLRCPTYPPSVNWMLRFLGAIAVASFLWIMKRHSYPWAKTFAILYLLYWVGSCTLPPARPAPGDQAIEKRCSLMTNFGFICSGHILVWYLWSPMLQITSTMDYWVALLIHCGTSLFAVALATFTPQISRGGAGELLAYVLHIWAFTISWCTTYFTSLLSWHISLWAIIGYDFVIWTFALAKRQHAADPHRWPAGLLASFLLLVVIAEIQGLCFRFEASPR